MTSGQQENGATGQDVEAKPQTSSNLIRQKLIQTRSQKRGLCIIIANFTDELDGYQNDVARIASLYESLNYDVIGGSNDSQWRDLRATEMRQQFQNLANNITNSSPTCDYHSVAIFILTSHGNIYHGAPTPSDHLTPAQVVNTLSKATHLKDVPKLLVLANLKSSEVASEPASFWRFSMLEQTSNTVLYQAHNLAHKSIVLPNRGSWFIETLVATFREHHQQREVLELLGDVNTQIREAFEHDNSDASADDDDAGFQVPSWAATLCSDFYLTPENERV